MTAPILEPTVGNLARATRALQAGELVGFPTETVYGLAGDATNDRAVAAIYAAKGRPTFNPLIVHVGSPTEAARHAEFPPAAAALARRFWPGALTLVLPRRSNCALSLLVSAGLDSVALRVPAHPAAQALLMICGLPLAGPSANPSGGVSPTRAEHVVAGLGDKVAMVLDGGPCSIGVESTVLSLVGATPQLLRPGGVSRAEIEAVLETGVEIGPDPGDDAAAGLRSPGQLASHYAPGLPVRVNAIDLRPGEALLAFGPTHLSAPTMLNLSPAGDVTEAAANLFAMLRDLDRPGPAGIAVMSIPEAGLGLAINDRLRRAAAPRR